MIIQRTMLLILGSTITNRNEDSDLIAIEIHSDLAHPLMRNVSVTTTVLELLDEILPYLPWNVRNKPLGLFVFGDSFRLLNESDRIASFFGAHGKKFTVKPIAGELYF